MRFIKFTFDRIFAALTWFALSLLVFMTVLTFTNVFCRYVLNFSIAWADEVSLILLVWFVFIAMAIGVRRNAHVSIDLLSMVIPAKWMGRFTKHLGLALTFVFGALLIYFGWVLILIGADSTLASFDLPSYLEYIFIPLSGLLIMYSAVAHWLHRESDGPEEDYLDTVFMNKADRHV